ncbi:DUF4870 domain-containing protein [Patescibacteria group bacterium]
MEENKTQNQEPQVKKEDQESVAEPVLDTNMEESKVEESDSTEKSEGADKHKAIAIIGYIIPILFFIPLVSEDKEDAFAKFHANQHLVLLISWVIINIVGGIIPFIGWFIILPIGTLTLIVCAIFGIVNASQGRIEKMPLIGGIEIIK